MSFLKFWKSFLGPISFSFGGGGGGGPSQTTSQTSNIPEYARPYVENMLGATQAQLFTTDKTGGTPATYDAQGNVLTPATEGTTSITGFKPYKPYSTNVNDYFAGPSPMQQQSYQGMSNMQTAPQVGEGSQFATAGGAGLLGTTQPAGMYGGMGAGLGMQGAGMGMQAAGAGQNYAQMATDPGSVRAYMSPYMQNVVDYQKGQALRDYQMASPMRAAKAIGQGAFGGNRAALETSEAQRGLMSQLQGIEASGAQNAFQQAQQAQQYGANLGLQGLQTGIQGINTGLQGAQIGLQGVGAQQAGYTGALNAGSTLGQLGQTQYGQQMGILQGQNTFGQQQQQMEQAKINQSISDYATAQQYPMLQLGLMSNMLRGLPMQSQTTQMYQAAPSYLQQGIGGLGAISNLYSSGAMGRKEGGIVGYKYGGAIPEPKLNGMAENLSEPQLKQLLQDKELDSGERQIFSDALQDKTKEKARYAGIAAAGGGIFDSQSYAGGGILAFADEGLVPEEKQVKQKPQTMAEFLALEKSLGPKGVLGSDYETAVKARSGDEKRLKRAEDLAGAKAWAEFGSTWSPGGMGQSALKAVGNYADSYGKLQDTEEALKAESTKNLYNLEVARRAEDSGNLKLANESYNRFQEGENRIKAAQISAAGANAAVNLKKEEKAAIKADLAKQLGREPTTIEVLGAYAKATSVADDSSDARLRIAANSAYQKWEATAMFDPKFAELNKKARKGDKDAVAELDRLKTAKKQEIYGEIAGTVPAQAQAQPTPSVMAPDKDGNISIPGKGTFKQLPNGNYVKVG